MSIRVGLLSFYTQRSKRKKAYASFDDDADEGVYCVPRGVAERTVCCVSVFLYW